MQKLRMQHSWTPARACPCCHRYFAGYAVRGQLRSLDSQAVSLVRRAEVDLLLKQKPGRANARPDTRALIGKRRLLSDNSSPSCNVGTKNAEHLPDPRLACPPACPWKRTVVRSASDRLQAA